MITYIMAVLGREKETHTQIERHRESEIEK